MMTEMSQQKLLNLTPKISTLTSCIYTVSSIQIFTLKTAQKIQFFCKKNRRKNLVFDVYAQTIQIS